MNVKGIIAISGRPGLFKVIAQSKSSVIVESLIDGKRTPAYASEKISTLEDISIFTYDEDVRLIDVFQSMIAKYDGGEGLNHKEAPTALANELLTILPNYDQERVYPSDIKKIFQWYNLLSKAGLLAAEESTENTTATEESTENTTQETTDNFADEATSKVEEVKESGEE